MRFIPLTIAICLLFGSPLLYAKGVGTSTALTLQEPSSARATALGEAMAAQSDDVTAMTYNPATLDTLTSGQASFIYHKGLEEDSFGQFHMGAPVKHGAAAFSLGYFNAGEIESFDGTTRRKVTIQKDLTLALGYSSHLGALGWGLAVKYLSSELAEREKGTAIASDFGIQIPVQSRSATGRTRRGELMLGASLQNLGSKMNYAGQSDNLPRLARVGASYLFPGRLSTKLYTDGIADLNESKIHPAVGLETFIGPMALRAGYQGGKASNEFSFGTGFHFSSYSLDYSFIMADRLDAQHLMSFSAKFQTGARDEALVRQKEPANSITNKSKTAEGNLYVPLNNQPRLVAPITPLGGKEDPARVYLVRPGDTLQSIAKQFYGKSEMWKVIYNSNKFILSDPTKLEAGQKIVLPAKLD